MSSEEANFAKGSTSIFTIYRNIYKFLGNKKLDAVYDVTVYGLR